MTKQNRSFKINSVVYHHIMANYHTRAATLASEGKQAQSFRDAVTNAIEKAIDGTGDDDVINSLTSYTSNGTYPTTGLNLPLAEKTVDVINALTGMATLKRIRAGSDNPRVGRNEFLTIVLVKGLEVFEADHKSPQQLPLIAEEGTTDEQADTQPNQENEVETGGNAPKGARTGKPQGKKGAKNG